MSYGFMSPVIEIRFNKIFDVAINETRILLELFITVRCPETRHEAQEPTHRCDGFF